MSGFIPKEQLTAYQRWELAAFDEAQAAPDSPQGDKLEATPAADAIQLPTAEDIERIHNEAHEAGYEAGRAAGYEEGLALAKQEAEHIAALGENLRQSLGALDQEVAEELLAVAVEIASQVLRQSLKVSPELLLPVVREAVAAMPLHHGHPALFLNPADAAMIRQHLGEQLAHNGWRIIEDGSVEAGGCRVEPGASEVDATLATRWKRVLEAIGTSAEWLPGKS